MQATIKRAMKNFSIKIFFICDKIKKINSVNMSEDFCKDLASFRPFDVGSESLSPNILNTYAFAEEDLKRQFNYLVSLFVFFAETRKINKFILSSAEVENFFIIFLIKIIS